MIIFVEVKSKFFINGSFIYSLIRRWHVGVIYMCMDLFVLIQPFYSLSAAASLNALGLFFCFCGTFLFIH